MKMKILELWIHLWPEALGSTHAQPYTAQVPSWRILGKTALPRKNFTKFRTALLKLLEPQWTDWMAFKWEFPSLSADSTTWGALCFPNPSPEGRAVLPVLCWICWASSISGILCPTWHHSCAPAPKSLLQNCNNAMTAQNRGLKLGPLNKCNSCLLNPIWRPYSQNISKQAVPCLFCRCQCGRWPTHWHSTFCCWRLPLQADLHLAMNWKTGKENWDWHCCSSWTQQWISHGSWQENKVSSFCLSTEKT